MKHDRRKYTILIHGSGGSVRGLRLEYQRKTTNLLAGLTDAVDILRKRDHFVVLSANERKGYVGLQVISSKNMKTVYDCFLQTIPGQWRDFWNLSPNRQADILWDEFDLDTLSELC